jgi:hypothetical protein
VLPEHPSAEEPKGSVALAVSPLADLGYLPIRAAAAIRQVMPARRLLVETTPTPAEAVRSGDARFGLIGAEEFFTTDDGGELVRAEDIEAVGVVGSRFAHVLVRADARDPRQWRRVGVGPEGGSSWRVAHLVLEAMGAADRVEVVVSEDPLNAEQLLKTGEVDALLLMLEHGHAGLMELLHAGGMQFLATCGRPIPPSKACDRIGRSRSTAYAICEMRPWLKPYPHCRSTSASCA